MKYDLRHVFFDGATGVCHAVVLLPMTQALREKGLRGLSRLQDGRGMLLPFPKSRPALTMTGMRFPIDVAFVDKHRRIASIVRMVPGQRHVEGPVDTDIAIEMRAGYFLDNGIPVGSPVHIRA